MWMKFFLTCVSILESVRRSVAVDKLAARNGKEGVASTSTDHFVDIPIHEYSERRAGVQPTFLKRRSGIVENPPWIEDDGSQPSSDHDSYILARVTIESENYCESIYEVKKVETLLVLDEQVNRPGGNWWKVFGLVSNNGGIIISKPMCASSPLNWTVRFNRELSSHEFFQSRGIQVPIARGKRGFRFIQLLTMPAEKPIRRDVLECGCEIKEPEAHRDICIQGKIISLSRGVGGDQSFFVYKFNPSSGFLNVIAHVCFS